MPLSIFLIATITWISTLLTPISLETRCYDLRWIPARCERRGSRYHKDSTHP